MNPLRTVLPYYPPTLTEQVVAFAHRYRAEMAQIGREALPLVAVPSSYSGVTEEELAAAGFSVCTHSQPTATAELSSPPSPNLPSLSPARQTLTPNPNPQPQA